MYPLEKNRLRMYGCCRYNYKRGGLTLKNKRKIQKRSLWRYPIQIPVEFYIPVKKKHRKVKIRAITKDISQNGFSFVACYEFQKPMFLEFIFRIPELRSKKERIYKLKGKIIWHHSWNRPVIYKTGICLLRGENLKIMKNMAEHLKCLIKNNKKIREKIYFKK